MDINNEKDILKESAESFEDVAEDTIIESELSEEELKETEELYDSFEDLTEDDFYCEPIKKKSCLVQKPIIISIVAFLLTAVIVLSSVLIYDLVIGEEEKFSVEGIWTVAEKPDSGVYYIFEDDGAFKVNIGGQVLTGSYLLEEVEDTSDESEEKTVYHVMTLTPNVFSNYESQTLVTFDEENNTMSLSFMYIPEVKLIKTDLPEFNVNGSKVTHASADEFGIDTFVGDEDIVGSWLFEDYTGDVIYTFNADGTGSLIQDYKDGGYSITVFFKYIAVDGKILITIELFDGSSSDGEINYYMDKGKIIINGIAFEKTK